MSTNHPITKGEITRFLHTRYGLGVRDVRLIGEGAWSRAFVFEHDGVNWVIRWSWFADNFERDAFAARFRTDDLPIPAIAEVDRYGDHSFAISRFVEGMYLEQLTAPAFRQTLPSLLQMLRALRAADLSGTAGYGIWNGEGIATHQTWQSFLLDDKDDSPGSLIKGWRANLASSPLGMDSFDRFWEPFARLVEQCFDERQLIHSDLINGNVLAADGRITALLDFGSSIFGDALYDVAWFTFYKPWFPQFGEVDLSRVLLDDFRADPRTNTVNLEARLRCYLLHIGLDSIAYNASRDRWANASEVVAYLETMVEGWNQT